MHVSPFLRHRAGTFLYSHTESIITNRLQFQVRFIGQFMAKKYIKYSSIFQYHRPFKIGPEHIASI